MMGLPASCDKPEGGADSERLAGEPLFAECDCALLISAIRQAARDTRSKVKRDRRSAIRFLEPEQLQQYLDYYGLKLSVKYIHKLIRRMQKRGPNGKRIKVSEDGVSQR